MPGRMQGALTVFACDHEMHPNLRRKTATRRSVRPTRGVRERAMLPIKRRRVVVALDEVLPNLRPNTLEHVPEVSEHLRRRIAQSQWRAHARCRPTRSCGIRHAGTHARASLPGSCAERPERFGLCLAVLGTSTCASVLALLSSAVGLRRRRGGAGTYPAVSAISTGGTKCDPC